MNQQVALKDILPNPFRHKNHEIQEEKVEALIDSFKATGIWPNITGRKSKDGKVERAFGDHRIEAATRLYGSNHQIEVAVEEISDEQMLKMMANENSEDWKTSFIVLMETVEAIVRADAAGKIQLLKRRDRRISDVNAATITEFIGGGIKKHKIEDALGALELINKKQLERDDFRGITNSQAAVLIVETHTAQKRVKHDPTFSKETPSKVGKAVSKGFKEGTLGIKKAREVTNRLTEHIAYKPTPPSEKFVTQLCSNIASILDPNRDSERIAKIQAVIDARDVLPKEQVQRVAQFLIDTGNDCFHWAAKLAPELESKIRKLELKALPSK